MPQSERLSTHGVLEEIENNPILRKQFMEIIMKELKEESELRGCVLGIVGDQLACLGKKK